MILSLTACGQESQNGTAQSGTTQNGTTDKSGDSGSDSTKITTSTDEPKDFKFPDNLPKKKVGAIGAYTGNELYVQWKNNLEAMSEKFNVEFQFVEATKSEDYASAVENLCTAGVDGIIMQGAYESVLQITEEYGVPLVTYCMTYPDDQMKLFATYDTFLGVITEDDTVAAEHAAEAMYEAGCRNVAIAGITRGLAEIMDNRADYFKKRFTELGGNIIAEDYTMVEFAKSIESFAAAHPEMDGIFSVILNESVFQAVTTEGLVGNIKLAGFDMSDSCDQFFEEGTLVFTATGQQATIVTAFAVLYNHMYDGTYLIEDRSKMVTRNFVEIHNSQEAADYDKYVRFSTCYSPEEVGYMIKGFNPDYTFEQFQEMHAAFSLEDVKKRANQ
jgi:ABC-type sugar transport system substrate-binding protein